MEVRTETKVTYDDRRKILVQNFSSVQEIKMSGKVVGESKINRVATFDEDGIRNVLKELLAERTKLEQAIKQGKESLSEVKELTSKEKELEEMIQRINQFNKSDKTNSQLEVQEKDLKIVKNDIDDIKRAIGSRLKL